MGQQLYRSAELSLLFPFSGLLDPSYDYDLHSLPALCARASAEPHNNGRNYRVCVIYMILILYFFRNILLILVGLIFIPVVGLTGFHIYLVFNGLTTNEQVTAKYGDNHSPFDKGPCFNCNFMCCRPLGPM